MIPDKLKQGDEIRIIAPAVSMARLKDNIKDIAIHNLESMGFKVSFGKNSFETGLYNSAPLKMKLEDLHEAFLDKNVKCILTAFGGFNSNELLDYIDYDIIRKNPKILCGYSDITALGNGIHAKTGLVTYSGPHFSTLGVKLGNEYTLDYFKKCIVDEMPFEIKPSEQWSDEAWYLNQEERHFYPNHGYKVVNEGQVVGKVIGGNLATFNLLQGTQYMPDISDSILFLEDDKLSMPQMFDRDLQSLIHTSNFKHVRGLVIGKFQIDFNIKDEELIQIIRSKKELENMPIIINASFGHTFPLFTFPIGGTAKINCNKRTATIEIINH